MKPIRKRRDTILNAMTFQESPAPYGVAIAPPAIIGEQRVLLHGVSWGTYKALSKDLGDSRACRLAFDSGEMEIMSPLIPHENSQFGIGQMVIILAVECGIPCRALGSLTCERDDLEKGFEPDGCFYIQNLKHVKGLTKLDFTIHPPPDLMVEVDMSTNSLSKLPICAALGVPEHWRFDGKVLEIRVLKGGRYFDAFESLAFPGLPLAQVLPKFVEMGNDDSTIVDRAFRAWIRAELRKRKAARQPPRKRRLK